MNDYKKMLKLLSKTNVEINIEKNIPDKTITIYCQNPWGYGELFIMFNNKGKLLKR